MVCQCDVNVNATEVTDGNQLRFGPIYDSLNSYSVYIT
jgi:hypothetical protein